MSKLFQKPIYRIFHTALIGIFIVTGVGPLPVNRSYARLNSSGSVLNLPAVGHMVSSSSMVIPPIVKGVTIFPDNPLELEFIVGRGDAQFSGSQLQQEALKMIKYFMATLTTPEEEMWVNLSPYEKNRIIPESFGQTKMGRDLLAQDYLLKQLSASLMYPENGLGKEFWDRVYSKAQRLYGTTDIPMNTFNKIWIVPEKAVVLEHQNSVFVVERHLKVMLEEDYRMLEQVQKESLGQQESSNDLELTAGVVREVLIPEIEREVNEGENFANLRQIYNAMILAVWYKQNLQKSLFGQLYVDQRKTKGIDVEDKEIKQKIYDQYIEAFKKGVYNYTKEEYDAVHQQVIPRRYFSGGAVAVKRVDAIRPRDLTETQRLYPELPDQTDVAFHIRNTEIGEGASASYVTEVDGNNEKLTREMAGETDEDFGPDRAMVAGVEDEQKPAFNTDRIRAKISSSGKEQRVIAARYRLDEEGKGSIVVSEEEKKQMGERFKTALLDPETFKGNSPRILEALHPLVKLLAGYNNPDRSSRSRFETIDQRLDKGINLLSARQRKALKSEIFELFSQASDDVFVSVLGTVFSRLESQVRYTRSAKFHFGNYSDVSFEFSLNTDYLISIEDQNGALVVGVGILPFMETIGFSSFRGIEQAMIEFDAGRLIADLEIDDVSVQKFAQENIELLKRIFVLLQSDFKDVEHYNYMYELMTQKNAEYRNSKDDFYGYLRSFGLTNYVKLLQQLEKIENIDDQIKVMLLMAFERGAIDVDQLDEFARNTKAVYEAYLKVMNEESYARLKALDLDLRPLEIREGGNRMAPQLRLPRNPGKLFTRQGGDVSREEEVVVDESDGSVSKSESVEIAEPGQRQSSSIRMELSRALLSIAAAGVISVGALLAFVDREDLEIAAEVAERIVTEQTEGPISSEDSERISKADGFKVRDDIPNRNEVDENSTKTSSGAKGNKPQDRKYEYAPPREKKPGTPEIPKGDEEQGTNWSSLEEKREETRAQANGSLIRDLEQIAQGGIMTIKAEILEGSEHIKGKVFFTGLFDQIRPGGKFQNGGVTIEGDQAVSQDQKVRVRVQVPAMKQGDQIGIPSLFGRVAGDFSGLEGKVEFVDGIYLRATQDIDTPFFVDYSLYKLENPSQYQFNITSAENTEYLQREFDVLNTHPALARIRDLLKAENTTVAEYVLRMKSVIRENMLYSMYFDTVIGEDQTFFGHLAAVLEANEKLRTECDLGSVHSYLMFRYKNIPAVYATGWIYKGGQFIQAYPGHAVLYYKDENGWNQFDSTTAMELDKDNYRGAFTKERAQAEAQASQATESQLDEIVKDQGPGAIGRFSISVGDLTRYVQRQWEQVELDRLFEARDIEGLKAFVRDQDNLIGMRAWALGPLVAERDIEFLTGLVEDINMDPVIINESLKALIALKETDAIDTIAQNTEIDYSHSSRALDALITLQASDQLIKYVENENMTANDRIRVFNSLKDGDTAAEHLGRLVLNPENAAKKIPGLAKALGNESGDLVGDNEIARAALEVLDASYANKDLLLAVFANSDLAVYIRRIALRKIDGPIIEGGASDANQRFGPDGNYSDEFRSYRENYKKALVKAIQLEYSDATKEIKEYAALSLFGSNYGFDWIEIFGDIEADIAQMIRKTDNDFPNLWIVDELNQALMNRGAPRGSMRYDPQREIVVKEFLISMIPFFEERIIDTENYFYSENGIRSYSMEGKSLDSLLLLAQRDISEAQQALLNIRNALRPVTEEEIDLEKVREDLKATDLTNLTIFTGEEVSLENKDEIYKSFLKKMEDFGFALFDTPLDFSAEDIAYMYGVPSENINELENRAETQDSNPGQKTQVFFIKGVHEVSHKVVEGDRLVDLAKLFYGEEDAERMYVRIQRRNGYKDGNIIWKDDDIIVPMTAAEFYRYKSPEVQRQRRDGAKETMLQMPPDKAMVAEVKEATFTKGGIDFNPQLLDLQIKRDGSGVALPLPEQPLENMHIEGFLPIIINVSPVGNIPMLLGLADEPGEEQKLSFNYR